MKDAWEQNPYRDEPIVKFFRELDKVKDDQRSLVLVTNGILELLVETLVKSKCKNQKRFLQDGRGYPYSAKLLILHEIHAISDETFMAFDWFRKIRNDAAHKPFFAVTADTLKKLKDANLKDPKNLYLLCVTLIGQLWNQNIDTFGPVFSPNMTKSQIDKGSA